MRHVLIPLLLAGVLGAPAAASEYVYLTAGEPGQVLCAPAPAGWESPDFDDTTWLSSAADTRVLLPDGGVPDAAGPLVAASPPGTPGDAGAPGCMGLHLRRHFDVGPEIDHLAALTLRVRYQDGFVAYVNGREVARRRVVAEAPLASETHGTERESFPIAVTPGLLRPVGNVLAVLVLPARPGRRVQVDVALDGADGPHIVRGPYLQRVGPTEGWMVVETDLETTIDLTWQTPSPRGARARSLSSPRQTRHVLHLTPLAAATTYHYRLVARAAGSGPGPGPGKDPPPVEMEGDFHTPPGGTQPLRFAVFGDVRSGHEIHAAIVRALVAEDPDLALVTGDLVDRGTDEAQWERYFEIAAPLLRQVAIYPAAGNHEYERAGRGLERFLSLFLRPQPTAWWSFDVAGVHFVLLDSEAYKNPEQRDWLEADLQEARRRKARGIFVVAHDGPYSSALHGDNQEAIRGYAPLYQKYSVSMAFSGHDHDYERLRVGGVDYVVSGGGGAELRKPRCGVPGRRSCGSRSRVFMNEHHYIMVEVRRDRFRLCPKRADGTLLEPCPTFPLR
ncbi:MAG TPA: metallophosphoesterase [Polyangia bacterium]|nr:metallophosphoesterase [Polyangia bacterium]